MGSCAQIRDVGSSAVARFVCPDAYFPGSVPLGSEEVGMLDRMAGCEYCQLCPVYPVRLVFHAIGQRTVSDQRHLVSDKLEETF